MRKLLLSILAFFALLASALAFLGFSKSGTNFALKTALKFIQSDELKISVSEISPLLSGTLKTSKITIADKSGQWLEIDDLNIDWSPDALLNGVLDIETLAAENITLARLPQSNTTETSSSSGFSLPLTLDIAEISLTELNIGEAVAGTAEKLSLQGGVMARQTEVNAEIMMVDLNRANALVRADLLYDLDANVLDINASADEKDGGFISSMLQLPGNPSLHLTVDGDGPLNNWTGVFEGTVGGVQVAKVTASYAKPSEGTHKIALKGGGAIDALLPPSMGQLFDGTSTIDLNAEIDPDGTIKIEKGALDTGSAVLSVKGALSASKDNDFQLSLTPKNQTIDLNFLDSEKASGWRALVSDLNVSVKGAANAADIQLDTKLARVQVPQGSIGDVDVSAIGKSFDLANRQGDLTANLLFGSSALSDENLARLIKAPFKIEAPLSLKGDQIAFDGIKIESAGLGGTISGTFDSAETTAKADIKLFLAPSVLPDPYAQKLTKPVAISANVDYAAENIAVDGLKISSSLIDINGDAGLENGTIRADLSGTLPNLGDFLANASGSGSFTLDASGTTQNPAFKAELDVGKAVLAEKEISDLKLSIDGALDAGVPSGAVTGSGEIAGQTISIASKLQGENGNINIPEISAEVGPNTLKGSLVLDAAMKPTGKIDFKFPDLSLLAALAGQMVEGDLTGDLSFMSKGDQLSGVVNASGSAIKASGLEVARPQLKLTANGAGLGDVSGNLQAESITMNGESAKDLNIDLKGQNDGLLVDLSAHYDGAALRNAVKISQDENGFDVVIQTLEGKPRKIDVKLAQPSALRIENGEVDLKDMRFSISGGTLALSGTVGSSLNVQSKFSDIPASLANLFSPNLGAGGTISGSTTVTGVTSDPNIKFDVKANGLTASQLASAGVKPVNIGANGTFASKKLQLKADLTNGQGLSINGGGSLDISNSNALSMRYSGVLPLAIINGQIADQGMQLAGDARLDIKLSGPATNPAIAGQVNVAGAQFQAVRQNLTLQNINGVADISNNQVRISNFSGTLFNGGTVSLNGTVGIAAGSGFPVDLKVAMKDATYSDGNLVRARLNGDLAMSGALSGDSKLSGEITLEEATITIPEVLPASISQINLKHINAPADIIKQDEELSRDTPGTSGGSGKMTLDMTVAAPNKVFVRGRGLDAEVAGRIKLTGTTANPVLSGGFKMTRGRLDVLGKRLTFTAGEVGFSGGLVPDLEMTATTVAGSSTIYVNVSGQANDPQFSFTSSDSLPEDEVVAQLLFERPSGSLSPLQIAQAADALAQLTGVQKDSFFSRLRKGAGVDDLDVSTDANGNAEVTAGKYLNSKTYLEVQGGDGTGKAAINLDVGKGLKLRGAVGGDGESSAGIYYEKEY